MDAVDPQRGHPRVRLGPPATPLGAARNLQFVTRPPADFEKVLAGNSSALTKGGKRTVRLLAKDSEAMVARDIDKWTRLICTASIRAAD